MQRQTLLSLLAFGAVGSDAFRWRENGDCGFMDTQCGKHCCGITDTCCGGDLCCGVVQSCHSGSKGHFCCDMMETKCGDGCCSGGGCTKSGVCCGKGMIAGDDDECHEDTCNNIIEYNTPPGCEVSSDDNTVLIPETNGITMVRKGAHICVESVEQCNGKTEIHKVGPGTVSSSVTSGSASYSMHNGVVTSSSSGSARMSFCLGDTDATESVICGQPLCDIDPTLECDERLDTEKKPSRLAAVEGGVNTAATGLKLLLVPLALAAMAQGMRRREML